MIFVRGVGGSGGWVHPVPIKNESDPLEASLTSLESELNHCNADHGSVSPVFSINLFEVA